MAIINSIVKFVMDLGGGVFLPFTIVVMGLLFKMNVSAQAFLESTSF